jgi:hypothetical protein
MATTATFPGFTVTEMHGMTWGWGSPQDEYSLDSALEHLAESALSLGGNAIVGLRIEAVTEVWGGIGPAGGPPGSGGSVGRISTTRSWLAYGTVVTVSRRTG